MYAAAALKSVLYIVAALANNAAYVPPPTPAFTKQDKLQYKGQLFERVVLIWAVKVRIVAAVAAVCSVLTIWLHSTSQTAVQASAFRMVCPHPNQSTLPSLSTIHPIFIFAFLSMLSGAAIRLRCFAALGRNFNFLVRISQDHELVTDGPYAYVRHPSYTGIWLLIAGTASMFLVDPGNYVQSCGLMRTQWSWLVAYWVVGGCITASSIARRGRIEDQMLHETFGHKWEEYAERVPYSFIPYVW